MREAVIAKGKHKAALPPQKTLVLVKANNNPPQLIYFGAFKSGSRIQLQQASAVR